MKAAAYSHADGGRVTSPEIEMWIEIRDYGAQAVYGRPMGAGEIRHINAAREILGFYKARKDSGDWPEWARSNPYGTQTLNQAMMAAKDYGWLTNE